MGCLHHYQCFKRRRYINICLLLLVVFASPAEQQQSSPATAAGTTNSRSCSLDEHQQTTACSAEQHMSNGKGSSTMTAATTTAAAVATRHLQEQIRTQLQMLSVLSSIAAGAFTTDAAMTLLQDAAELRESLKHGAAATRWARLKARSAKGKKGTTIPGDMQHQGVFSRGILIVAGGRHQFLNAYILLQLLRHPTINCSLPAELIYYGSHEFDLGTARLITAHAVKTGTQVKLIDGYEAAAATELKPHKPIVHLTGFKTKVHALAFVTSFDQVLLLDSDNTPLADPTYLFDSAAFAASGNLQWLDFWTNQWMQPALYSLLGLDVPWEANPGFRASEAGQILLDRVAHYDVLEWLWLLNTHSSSGVPGVREAGVVGKCIWGDKDTYLIAFQLAGKASCVTNVPHHPLQALSRPGDSGVFVHAGMLQRGWHGELLFLHRTAAGKLWPHCAWHNRQGCKVWGATTPVDQEQLLPSVRDVTAMQLEPHRVDLVWQEQHCGSGLGPSAGQADVVYDRRADGGDGSKQQLSNGSKQQVSNNTMLACDLTKSAGLLPIPVIALRRLPAQVQQMLDITYSTFLDTVLQPVGGDVAEYQHYDEAELDPYL
ncbi:mannosyltransferase putative-domain-containing protein [Scenedesmus sp. NREL 46B-D3]|nr:mannosyltransferase putative-domain-containing protein [Scenedesmus sp. NREL 46B-D3]